MICKVTDVVLGSVFLKKSRVQNSTKWTKCAFSNFTTDSNIEGKLTKRKGTGKSGSTTSLVRQYHGMSSDG